MLYQIQAMLVGKCTISLTINVKCGVVISPNVSSVGRDLKILYRIGHIWGRMHITNDDHMNICAHWIKTHIFTNIQPLNSQFSVHIYHITRKPTKYITKSIHGHVNIYFLQIVDFKKSRFIFYFMSQKM